MSILQNKGQKAVVIESTTFSNSYSNSKHTNLLKSKIFAPKLLFICIIFLLLALPCPIFPQDSRFSSDGKGRPPSLWRDPVIIG